MRFWWGGRGEVRIRDLGSGEGMVGLDGASCVGSIWVGGGAGAGGIGGLFVDAGEGIGMVEGVGW